MITQFVTNALSNKHTTIAAAIYAAGKWGCKLVGIWWPGHQAQLDSTADLLETVGVFYLGAAAGDAQKSLQKEEADTTFVKKTEPTPKP